TMKGKVLFCNFEIQPAFFQHRLKAVEKEKQINLKSGALDLWNLRGHFASYDVLIPKIIERAKDGMYALIILDPVYKLYGNIDENSAGAVANLMNALELLSVE